VRNQLERLKAQAEEEVFHGHLNKYAGSCFCPSLQQNVLEKETEGNLSNFCAPKNSSVHCKMCVDMGSKGSFGLFRRVLVACDWIFDWFRLWGSNQTLCSQIRD
jgi:hypothetical protein